MDPWKLPMNPSEVDLYVLKFFDQPLSQSDFMQQMFVLGVGPTALCLKLP